MNHITFNTELPTGEAPEWVQLLPAGPEIVGVDGRSWLFDQASMDNVIAAFPRRGRPLVIDWEHSSEIRAPKGLAAPAAGWMMELQARGGELWARVEWTDLGAEQVGGRLYRYLSPVFTYEKDTGRIVEIVSAGLTNSPNLRLAALNREDKHSNQEDHMPLKIVAKALGLDDGSTADQIVTAVNSLKVKAEKTPAVPTAVCRALGLADDASPDGVALAVNSLKATTLDITKVVPRADYDQALAKAANLETKLKDQEAAKAESEITALVDQAVKDGKVAPASKDFYLAACRQQGGVDEFKKFLTSAPVIGDDKAARRDVGQDGAPKLTDIELAVCRDLGIEPADYAKTISKEAK